MWKNDASKLLAMPALAFAAGVVIHQPMQADVCSGGATTVCVDNASGSCITNPGYTWWVGHQNSYILYTNAVCVNM